MARTPPLSKTSGLPLPSLVHRLPTWALTVAGLAVTAGALRGGLIKRLAFGAVGSALTAAAAAKAVNDRGHAPVDQGPSTLS